MRTYLCKEGTQEFIMKAKNRNEAEELAKIYNAIVIKELKTKTMKTKRKKNKMITPLSKEELLQIKLMKKEWNIKSQNFIKYGTYYPN